MPYANTEAMTKHLEEISLEVALGAHAILLCDDAGWHQRDGRLRIPDNITLLSLLPYSPQLNPAVFECLEWFVGPGGRISSMAHRQPCGCKHEGCNHPQSIDLCALAHSFSSASLRSTLGQGVPATAGFTPPSSDMGTSTAFGSRAAAGYRSAVAPLFASHQNPDSCQGFDGDLSG
jgi:hypothetical protein